MFYYEIVLIVLFKDMFDLSNLIFRDFCYHTILWIMFQASNIHEYIFAFGNKFDEIKKEQLLNYTEKVPRLLCPMMAGYAEVGTNVVK